MRCLENPWRLASTLLLTVGALLGRPLAAVAIVSFGQPAPICSNALVDEDSGIEAYSVSAGDGQGNWVTLWAGQASPGLVGQSDEIWVERSSDGGATWTAATALMGVAGPDDTPTLATDRAGAWVAAWYNSTQGEVLISRSIDNGASWSAASAYDLIRPKLATDEAGTWVLVADDGSTNILALRSVDNGQTWEPAVNLDTDQPINTFGDFNAVLATDRAGNWVVNWRRFGEEFSVHSSDNGATWSTPVLLGSYGNAGSGLAPGAIATDRQGHWLAVWENTPGPGTNTDLAYALSTDNGATWSPQAPFPAIAADDVGADVAIVLEAGADGTLYALWNILGGGPTGKDPDIFMSRSVDGGYTWTSPTAVNLLARGDGDAHDVSYHLGYDGDRGWIATWTSLNSLGGTIGEDPDILFARAQDDCPTTPPTGCLTPTQPEAARILIKDDLHGGGDRLTWNWTAGAATTPADIGDPTSTASYALCIYDKAGGLLRSVFEADAKAGIGCDGSPCWEATSSGYKYSDMSGQNGAIRSLAISAGEAGRAKIKIKAAGAALGPPHMPLAKDPAVKVQLLNLDTNKCWESTFSTTTLSDSLRFRARSD